MKKFLFLFLLAIACISTGTLSGTERTYTILVIQSYTNRTPWNDQLSLGIQDGLKKEGVHATVTTEYLNADYWTFASESVIMRRICQRARQQKTDLIITSGDEAFYTLMHCGDSLPYELPIVVSGIKFPDEKLLEKSKNVCGYTAKVNCDHLLKEAKRVFPKRKEIICLTDNSLLAHIGVKKMKEAWRRFSHDNPDYSFHEMNVQMPNPVIASVCYEYNAFNRIVVAPKWTPFLSFVGKNSKAPVFACQNLALTNGVFAVYDVKAYNGALLAGKRAAQLLKGVSPATLGITNLSGGFLYDFKQLEFFHVDEKVVEDHGTILNIPLIERYRGWLFVFYIVVLAALVGLVVWLVRVNRRESRKRIRAQMRLLVQHRLVEQRDEFDNIFGSIRDGLITYDTDFRIHFMNQALVKMLNLSPEIISTRAYEGQMSGSIFHIYMEGKDILQDMLQQVLTQKVPVSIPEKAFMQESNKKIYFPVSGEVVPIFAKERMAGMAIVCRNISEEELQKRFFNLAVEESSIYPWQFDLNMNCFHVPEGFLKRINYPETTEYISIEEMEQLIHPDDLLHTQQRFDSILQGNELNLRMNFRLKSAEENYEWWEFRSTAYDGLISGAPYTVVGVCQSIQRYKDTEQALIAARDRALQADKLKSAFLANMSHEIRTPLNSIVGFSDLLRDLDAFSKEEIQQFVETININCTLLLALISDILDLSRIESGSMEFQMENYNLTGIVQEIFDSQRLSMPAGVELRTELPEGEGVSVITDAVRLKQVINNLINNAKKFTLEGSITFGYKIESPDQILLFAQDTGCGISEQAQHYIFERFYKADSFTQGAGLGLSICRTIIEHLGGTISVSSEIDKGTRFEVRIPNRIL